MISIKFPLAGCAAAAALGALAAVGVAHAQPMGGQPQGAQSEASQIQHLHDALHLTSSQEQAWRAYQGGAQPTPDQEGQMRAMGQMSLASMTTPQRLDMINQGMTLQLATFHRSAAATRTFYATLTPAQQRTFDQITAPPAQGGQGER